MFQLILVIQALVAAAMCGVILMQQSEGGGLGTGGSPAGFLSARGASDFLSRSTAVLATAFIVLSVALAVIAAGNSKGVGKLDTSLVKGAAAPVVDPANPVPAAPGAVPLDNGVTLPGGTQTTPAAPAKGAPAPAAKTDTVPLQQ